MDQLYNNRIQSAVLDSPGVSNQFRKEVAIKEKGLKKELGDLKVSHYKQEAKEFTRDASLKGSKLINKFLGSKTKAERILKKAKQATIVENQPVYSKDRSRFFNEDYQEEKRTLFFK